MKYLLAVVLPAVLVMALAHAQETTTIEFDPPTSRVDGTELDPATEIDSYRLYCRFLDAEQFADHVMEIPGLTEQGHHETTYGEFLPERGRYDCALTAVDTEGRESDYSNIVQVSWLSPPGEPTNVIIIR